MFMLFKCVYGWWYCRTHTILIWGVVNPVASREHFWLKDNSYSNFKMKTFPQKFYTNYGYFSRYCVSSSRRFVTRVKVVNIPYCMLKAHILKENVLCLEYKL